MLSISSFALLCYASSPLGAVASKQQLKFQCHLYGFAVSILQNSKHSEVKAIFIYLNKAPRQVNIPKILPKSRLDLLF